MTARAVARGLLFLATTGTLAAACSSGSGGSGASSARSTSTTTAPTRVTQCGQDPSVRPTRIMIACGDGNFYLEALKWDSWGSGRAVATGRAEQNDCTPYCAAGHFHAYPARVTLSAPVETKSGRMFSTVRIDFIGASPIKDRFEVTTIPTAPLGG